MCSAPWPHANHGPTRCGQCMECRLAYSREWAIRMTHEQVMHDASCFLTLTYDEAHLPQHGQLLKRDLILFFKRLRKALGRFRYVACGEYGELRRRPHFHIALFGMDFRADRLVDRLGSQGDQMFTSASLSPVWTLGAHKIGELTFESAAYIARYITTRIVQSDKVSPLPLACDPDTGELVMPNPEFLVCSKGRKAGQGIGGAWFRDYFMTDAFPHGRIITSQGTPAPIPRYYKTLLIEEGKDLSLQLQYNATKHMYSDLKKLYLENSPARRAARTKYAEARTGAFKRETDKS